ncbi:MAG: PLP-dependent transferase [Planctomycetes bacterium]|nr:PLP-dependent transferase [Planctomycetota bacterium]
MIADLRSDTVTRPSEAMWQAMRAAPLGDDVLGDEPTVQKLEERIAHLLGKEAALFTPSGTMANQLAIKSQCESGDEIVAHHDSHIIHYETGAPAALSGCMINPLEGEGGIFTADDVAAAHRPANIHAPRPRLLVVENTHNRGGGTVWTLQAFKCVATKARDIGLLIHVDGARLWNACVAGGYEPGAFAEHADSISVCFSKGLGCPAGSALCGTRKMIERARRFRKMFGGGMRQSGLLAGAALFALDHNIKRLAEDHRHAKQLAEGVGRVSGLRPHAAPDSIPSNMVFVNVDPSLGSAAQFTAALEKRGVRTLPLDPARLRAVTHLDVTSAHITHAIAQFGEVARELAGSSRRG